MQKVYTVCIAIGLAIPLFSLVLGGLGDFFGGLFEGVSNLFDGFDLHFDPTIDLGDTSLSIFPFSLQSICAGLLMFGAIGKLFYNSTNILWVNITAGVIGYIMAMLMQTFIKKLKKVEHTTYSKEELLLFDAKVINTIKAGAYGSISVTTYDGITTSYPAKAEDTNKIIKQDTIVVIKRFEKNVAIVDEKDLTKKYAE